MADAAEVPPTDPNAKAGYTFDPYKDPCQLVDIHSPTIPFHNYRQIHVSENAWFAGITAQSIKEIPQCPPLWQDVGHYWKTVALAGWMFYEYGLNSKGSFAVRIAEVVGSVAGWNVLTKTVLPMIGVSL